MKRAANEKTERNNELYEDWKSGMTGIRLVGKYRISTAAIYKIIERHKARESIDNSVE